MNRISRKIAKTAGLAAGAAALASLTSYVTARMMIKMSLDRKPPEIFENADKMFSGADKEEGFFRAVDEAAEKLQRKENETVSIKSFDGTELLGHWIPVPDAKRVIIAMHGWRSSWTRDFGLVSDSWEEYGCSVLYAEQRGQNGSGGDYIGLGLTERYDCLEWIKWVTGRVGEDVPVYLCGVSMGATTVLMAAGLGLPENVRGVIADCGFTSPRDIWKHVANNNLHISFRMGGAMADALLKKKLNAGGADCSTVDAMKVCRTPVIFIHGSDDRFVPVEMSYRNYDACAAPRRIYIVPGAGHAMSYYVDKAGYEAAVRDFWNDFDKGPALLPEKQGV